MRLGSLNLTGLIVITVLVQTGLALAEEMELPALEIEGRGATLLFAGSKDKKTVALTFDDGPHPQRTPLILNVLQREGVPATFFLVGKNVLANPDLVRRTLAEGHEIANHTYNHSNLKNLGASAAANELRMTQEAIVEACGYHPTLFRPPYGALDLKTMAILANQGLTAVFWSIDTEDWKASFPHEIQDEVLTNLANGSIILLHDHAPPTADILPTLIAEIRGRGYSFQTVSQLFGLSSATLVAKGEGVVEATSAAVVEQPVHFAAKPLPTPQLIASATPPSVPIFEIPVASTQVPEPRLPKPVDFPTAGEEPQPASVEVLVPPSPTETLELPTDTPTPTDTPVPETATPISTASSTSTPTSTRPPSPTSTASFTSTPKSTRTPSPTSTASPTSSPTWTPPPTRTPTPTFTRSPNPTPTATVEYAVAVDAPKRASRIYRLRPVETFSRPLEAIPRTRVQGPLPEGGASSERNRANGNLGYSHDSLPRELSR